MNEACPFLSSSVYIRVMNERVRQVEKGCVHRFMFPPWFVGGEHVVGYTLGLAIFMIKKDGK